jgi:hypothetical protein
MKRILKHDTSLMYEKKKRVALPSGRDGFGGRGQDSFGAILWVFGALKSTKQN